MTQAVFDNRRRCHYPRDVSQSVGRVFGPNTYNEWLTMTEVEAGPDDQWTAYFRPATRAEFEAEMRQRMGHRPVDA